MSTREKGTRRKRIQKAAVVAAGLAFVLFVLAKCKPDVKTVGIPCYDLEIIENTSDQATLAKMASAINPAVRHAAVKKLTDQASLAQVVVKDSDSGVRCAAVNNLTDQAVLAQVAANDSDSGVRLAVMNNLTDQALLAQIAVKNNDSNVRRAAVEKLVDPELLATMGMWVKPELTRQVNDQTLLAKISIDAKDYEIRLAAIGNLTDQTLLAQIAVKDSNSNVRHAAVEKLTEQVALAQVAATGSDSSVRCTAVENLTNQALLAELAVKDREHDVRCHAVEKLSDQILLAKVIREAKYLDIRVAAIDKIANQELLRQWAGSDHQAAIRQAAARQIGDDKFLLQRMSKEPSASVRATIVETLRGKEALREVALSAYHQKDRVLALNRLRKDWADQVFEVATAHEALADRVLKTLAEIDNGKLLKMALEGEFDVLRAAAVQRLSDPATLEKTALKADDRELLKILLTKIDDKEILRRISENKGTDRAMRLAAAQKCGLETWPFIFSRATGRGATPQTLGDALAAVALFPRVQPEAQDGVQQACLNLIRRGDESRIPEMVDLLENYGDKSLAEDYLNCGQPDLGFAGRAWAGKRGYNVGTGNGSNRAGWGSGR